MPFRRADTRGYGCCLYITETFLMHRPLLSVLLLVIVSCSGRRWLSPPFRVALRRPVRATSSCGRPASRYCSPQDFTSLTGGRVACRQLSLCTTHIPGFVHTPEKVVDGLGFSWWQSEVGVSDVSLVVSLQRTIQVARIRVVFKVPPGRQWTIQRSRDGGRSFTPWHHFVESKSDCRSLHGLPVDGIDSAANASCSVSRSSAGFQVVVDLLKGRPGAKFDLSRSVQDFITTDAVRLDLLQFGEPFRLDSLRKQGYYAIREIEVLGRCWCCGPSPPGSTEPCQCCRNSYYQKTNPLTSVPTQTTTRGDFRKGCTCNEAGSIQVLKHKVQKCRIGGQEVESQKCLCKINVVGRQCNRCKAGYYHLEKVNPIGCQACDCNILGSPSDKCNRATGQCICRHGYTGRSCDQCKNGKTLFPTCHGCGNCSAYLVKSLRGFRRHVAKGFKVVKDYIPRVSNVTVEKTLELATKQNIVLSHLNILFGNISEQAEAVINATSLFESDVFDVKSLVNISIVKSEHVKVSVNKSWNDAVQLFHRARDKANRVTDLIAKVRNLSHTLEVAVNEDNLVILKDARNLVNGINQVDFTEQEYNTLGCRKSVNQIVLLLEVAWKESSGLYKAANNTLKETWLYIDMLKDIIVKADIMNRTLVRIGQNFEMTTTLNSYAEKRVEVFPAAVQQVESKLLVVEIEVEKAKTTYKRVQSQLEAHSAYKLRNSLEHDMNNLKQRLERDPELTDSVNRMKNYSLQFTSDLEAMEQYYYGLINEDHPVAALFHYTPLIVYQADSALSYGKIGQSAAAEGKRKSKKIKNTSVKMQIKAEGLLEQARRWNGKLKEIYVTTLVVQYDVQSKMMIAEAWEVELNQVTIQLVELNINGSIRLRHILQKSREIKQLTRKQNRNAIAIAHQVSDAEVRAKSLDLIVRNVRSQEQKALMLVVGAAAGQKVTETILSSISNAQKHVAHRLNSFEQRFKILRQQIKSALKISKRRYKEVRTKQKRLRKSRDNQL
ncbi:laminin-like protein epi-1 [Corticium candelabrum]|uniref:laminin-like protein epi-1 n=1 Tax=Corticium candelabrum TaxID=121492 RepID=UPI002E267953|nr:laminin-like protein epi-1 [Corticium candelabrum]